MGGFELVAGVIGIFFVAGIGVGVLLVIALPLFRRGGPGGRGRGGRSRGGYHNRDDWQEPPGPGEYGGPPRWPGL